MVPNPQHIVDKKLESSCGLRTQGLKVLRSRQKEQAEDGQLGNIFWQG